MKPVAAAVATVFFLLTGAMPGQSATRWASAAKASIHPGVQTNTPAGQCTANFVFYDSRNVYIGQAAHCATRSDSAFATDGCRTPSYPLGTRVRVDGASRPGTLVYSSWLTMKAAKERSAAVCAGNDFALVRLDRRDRGRVNPSIPFWGGPTGSARSLADFTDVYSYGNSSLRLGIEQLSPKYGKSVESWNRGWTHGFYTVTPGIPGDSGSAVLDARGRAVAVVVTLEEFLPAENGATDLAKALAYMKAKVPSLRGVKLALGTTRFAPL